MPDILTYEEASQLARCSVSTLRGLLRSGKLPSARLGRERVIPRDAFVAKLNALAVEASTALQHRQPVQRKGRRKALV